MTAKVTPKMTKQGILWGYITLPEQKEGVLTSRDPGLAYLQSPQK